MLRTALLLDHLRRVTGTHDVDAALLVAAQAIRQANLGNPDAGILVRDSVYLSASDVILGLRLEDFVQPTRFAA